MLLVIDNFDSFTYNIVQYLGELGAVQRVFRNDEITVKEAIALNPDAIIISPGPGNPDEAGISLSLIEAFCEKRPILGVCLGHQCLAQYFGGNIVRSPLLMHGKTSMISHEGKSLFASMANPFPATRYHSLVIEPQSLPQCFQVTAYSEDREIMGIEHKNRPIWGVQFHPESYATENGIQIFKNFLQMTSERLSSKS